jgi:hydroxymethylbilane synthase
VSAEVTDTAAAEALGLEAARQLRAAGGQVCLDAAAALSAGA